MRSYPIWNVISGTDRAQQPNFGANGSFTQTIYVGSGPQNSHELAHLRVEEHTDRVGRRIFTFSIDGEIVKRGVFEPKTGEFNHTDPSIEA